LPRIFQQNKSFHVLIVDDNSPDGTAEATKKLQKNNDRVHLLERPRKMGLGTAYVAGFKYALQNGFDHVFEMDADFSHNPKALNDLYSAAKEYDLVIGSRYKSGVNVVNWPMRRLLLSYFANVYTRIITGMPVRERSWKRWTSTPFARTGTAFRSRQISGLGNLASRWERCRSFL
jgi:dolichol-phosphate mannosyltransferase